MWWWTLLRYMYIFRQILTWNYMYRYMSIELIKIDFIDKTPNTDYRHHITQTWKTFIPFKCREHSINYSMQFTNPVIQTIFFNEATFEFVFLQHKVSQSSMFVPSTKKKKYFSLTTYLDLQSYGNDFVWIIAVTYIHYTVQYSSLYGNFEHPLR